MLYLICPDMQNSAPRVKPHNLMQHLQYKRKSLLAVWVQGPQAVAYFSQIAKGAMLQDKLAGRWNFKKVCDENQIISQTICVFVLHARLAKLKREFDIHLLYMTYHFSSTKHYSPLSLTSRCPNVCTRGMISNPLE